MDVRDWKLFVLLAILCLFASTQARAQNITSLSPTSAAVGASVTIAGSGFGTTQGTSTVTFNRTVASPTSWSASTIEVPVPAGATTGNVAVTVAGVTSNGAAFTVVPAPVISNLSVTSGIVGTSVTITGTSFGATQGSGTVSFNGTDATSTSWGATSIVVTVPATATTGNVVVSASGVASNGVNFTVTEGLGITSVVPTSGVVGTEVAVAGLGFGATHGTSTISLNGTSAVVASWSDTSIVALVPAGASSGPFSVTVNSNTVNSGSFTVTPLPSGWSDTDIGSVGLSGSGTYANGTFTVKGAGQGIGNGTTSDAIHFSYQPLSGDGTIVARVVSLQGSSAQAGVMIRETLSPGATNSYTFYWNLYSYMSFTYRTTTGGSTTLGSNQGGLSLPYWIKLVRSGNSFSGYRSADGLNWTQAGTTQTISMAQSVYIGLAVSSQTTLALATATLDNVSINSTASPAPVITSTSATTGPVGSQVTINGTGFGTTQNGSVVTLNAVPVIINSWSGTSIAITIPSGAASGPLLVSVAPNMNDSNAVTFEVTTQPLPTSWLDTDVGAVGVAGTATYANGTFTVIGAGAGINNGSTSDAVHFVYQPLSGDGTIVARVVSLQGSSAQAGVMIRETLAPGATQATTFYWNGNSFLSFVYRATTGGTNTMINQGGLSLPYWVKVVRSGSTFAAYRSADGINWTQTGTTQTITMAQNVYIGLAVSSQTTSAVATATFDNVSTSSSAAPSPIITSISATTGSIGSQVVVSGSGFGTLQGASLVTLNGTAVTINSWSSTAIIITIPTGATSGYLVASVAPTMDDSNPFSFTVTSQPLPTQFLNRDFGQVGLGGSATYSNGVFTVKGAGTGIYNGLTSDAMQFVYQPWSGDGTIVARVISMQGNSGSYEAAGVMIRETLSSGATNACACFTGVSTYAIFSDRTTTGGATSFAHGQAGYSLPYWVKLVRSGSTFTGYWSTDGSNWIQVGSAQITMAQNIYIGLAVTSNSTTILSTGTFDNVSISSTTTPAPAITSVSATTGSVGSEVLITGSGFGNTQNGSFVFLNDAAVTINSWSNTAIDITIPTGASSGYLAVSVAASMNGSNAVFFTITAQPLVTPWLDQDIGLVGLTGSATYASGTFTVAGAGSGIYNGSTSDSMHFVYQPLSGDGTIIARVLTLQGASAQAGAMIRETLTPGSTHGFSFFWNGNSFLSFFYRTTTGGSNAGANQGGLSLPYWVKLLRSGNTFAAYRSPDGINWTQTGTAQTITMAQNVYIGLAVSSESTTALATATFDNVSVTIGTTPFVTGVSPIFGAVGTAVTITGSDFGTTQGTSTITFNGAAATSILSWMNTQIVANVPVSTPPDAGPVVVTVGSISSPPNVTFTTIKPTITSLSPPASQLLSSVTLNGSGFGASQGSSAVYFNGIPAANTSFWSDTSITVQVPSNATSGSMTVTVDGITSNSLPFTILEALSITAISQNVGPVGTTVTITGTGFGPTQSSSVAGFYGAAAAVSSWSDTQIVATVPGGASSGPVNVTVGNVAVAGPWFTLSSVSSLTDSLGNPTTYTTEVIGSRWVPVSSQGSGCSSCSMRGTVQQSYDTRGNLLTKTNELGATTTYTYDSNNNVTSVAVPIAPDTYATTKYTYNGFGEVLTTTDPMGNVTTNSYDSKGNLLSVTSPSPNGSTAASVTQFAYNSLGELTQITDPRSNATVLTYTSAGLIATITDAQSHVTTYGYDVSGNRTSVKDANNQTTSFAYDAGSRLKTITYPDSTTTTFTYDVRGRRTSVTDQNGKTTNYAYDDADRLTTVTDAASNVTTYGYDTENNLTSIQDANGHSTAFTYDAFGRVIRTAFPSSLVEYYYYDAVGNLITKTDRKGQTINYTYDQLNRLMQKAYPDSTTVNYIYDNDSRLTQVTDPTGTYQFTFDNMGRLTQAITQYTFLTGRNFSTSYTYDAASNRTGFTDPESGSTSYVYDTLNRLQTLTPPAAISGGNFGFGYDVLSRRTSLTRPNTVNTTYSYDNLSRLLSVTHATGGTTLDGASYTVDNAGNRLTRTPLPTGTASTFGYDNIYQLLSVMQGGTSTESYTYDSVGNRLSNLAGSGWSNNSSNELTARPGLTYTYDDNGNTLTKTDSTGTTTYTWDFENRLTSVTLPATGGTVTFKYDPFGRRIQKTSSGATSIFAYDSANLIEETNSSGAVVARYAQGTNVDEPLAMLRSAATNYYEADGLGSITSLTNSSGAAAETYTYDSFGKVTASSGSLTNPFQYTARESDSETGLYYYRARYYDPIAGRFLSEDPTRPNDAINFYAYTGNNPINFTDPLGLYDTAPDVPKPLPPRLDQFMKCMDGCTDKSQFVTGTTNGKHADPGHAAGTTVDLRPIGTPSDKVFCCAGKCGAVFGLDERKIKTKNGTGLHFHLQLEMSIVPNAPNSIPDRPECKPGKCDAAKGDKK